MLNFRGCILLVPLSSGYLLDLSFTQDPIVTNEGKGWDPRGLNVQVVILLGSVQGVDPSYSENDLLFPLSTTLNPKQHVFFHGCLVKHAFFG